MTDRKKDKLSGDFLARKKAKAEKDQRQRNIDRIPQIERKIESCKKSIESLQTIINELDSKLRRIKQKDALENTFYLIPLLLAIIFVGYLVYRGLAETPTVSIDFNVGEIIGGSLMGTGALIAGVTYAFRLIRRE